MRTIKTATRFKRDFNRVQGGDYSKTIQKDFSVLVHLLANDISLPSPYRDHALSGEWKGFRDCHIHPDLVLIYRMVGSNLLELARIGSHSELF